MTMCYGRVMTTNRGTKRRSLRVDDSLWTRFAAFCSDRGVSITARLIQHMKNDVGDAGTEGSKSA